MLPEQGTGKLNHLNYYYGIILFNKIIIVPEEEKENKFNETHLLCQSVLPKHVNTSIINNIVHNQLFITRLAIQKHHHLYDIL